MNSIFEELKIEVSNFLDWSKSFEHDGNEWETGYPYWFRIYTLIGKVLSGYKFIELTPEVKENIFYLLARDNEMEEIATLLSEYPDYIISFAKEGLDYQDYEARWQLAHSIWKYGQTYSEVEGILLRYYKDLDEYVRRRALLALGYMKSIYAEQFALESWNTALEYQRIAALYVLDEINSTKIDDILKEGEKDHYETVRSNVKTIKERRGNSNVLYGSEGIKNKNGGN
ncbi:HEAT repeat domain-containing protein [Paenibacillus elgii]|uniref:HEAT repeat domain-containing protein n=1 Tax=Paenibacillus elgii TaxID=189691 RepID=UPI0013D589FA|nr:HEAT repeat domain-containing protein [Paenibacillus elgii]